MKDPERDNRMDANGAGSTAGVSNLKRAKGVPMGPMALMPLGMTGVVCGGVQCPGQLCHVYGTGESIL